MTTLPEKVPVLKAEMICRERASDVDGRRCLIAWASHVCRDVFDTEALAIFQQFCKPIRLEMNDGKGELIAPANWMPEHSQEEAADLWNRVIPSIDFDGQRYTRRGDHFYLSPVASEGGGK